MIAVKELGIRFATCLLGVLCLMSFAPALLEAQEFDPESSLERPEEIYVTSQYPGPALWQVSNGENILWIIGELDFLPKDLSWDSSRVDWIMSQSQEFLSPPMVQAGPSGFFNALSVARKIGQINELADDQGLVDVLPTRLYERYLAAKALYAPKNKDIDELRPHFAAQLLLQGALPVLELENSDRLDVLEKLNDLAEDHNVPTREFISNLPIDLVLESLEHTPREIEILCLDRVLTSIEALSERDLTSEAAANNAWAKGRVSTLIEYKAPQLVGGIGCAVNEAGEIFQKAGIQTEKQWLHAVSRALETNRSSFALLPMHQLLEPDGLLMELEKMGYNINETQ